MTIQVLDRAMRIVEVVDRQGKATLTSLSAKAKLPMSTVSRIVDSLMSHGLLEQDPVTRSYQLGARFVFLASRANNRRGLVEIARPVIERLCAESQEDSGLSVLRGTHATIVDRVEGPHPLKIIDVLGQPVPLYCGAFRKLLLAHQTPEWIERYLNSVEFVRFTPRTITSRVVLLKELRLIREQGYSVSFGEYLSDAGGVAAPVFGPRDGIEAAVFIVGPKTRITEQTVSQLVRLVVQAGRDITKLLRGEPRGDGGGQRRPGRSRSSQTAKAASEQQGRRLVATKGG